MIDTAKVLLYLDALKKSEERQNFETLWQSGAEFCNPDNSDIQTVSAKGQRRRVTRITDVGIEARREFASGMYSWAIGDGEFFRFGAADRELRDIQEVKDWFSSVNEITLEEIKRSNFDAEVLQSFGELSYIGTTATYTEWHEGALNFKTQHISQFWFDVDARGMVNVMFVEIPLTPKQILDEFGDKTPEDIKAKAQKNVRDELRVVQYCSKNPDAKPTLLPEDQPYTSHYILMDEKNKPILRVDGHETFPFAVGRLYKAKNEMYGRSCYMESAQSVSLNNDQEYTIIRGGQERASPPWVESADSRVRIIKTNGYTRMIHDPTALGGPPVQMASQADVGINEAMLDRSEDRVNKAFLRDAWNPILDYRNMTKYETAQRIGIGLSKTTPPINKWHSEYANPLFNRIYEILSKKGKYPDMPSVLEGRKFKVEYISKAALALKEIQLNNTMAYVGDMLEIAQADPSVLDTINFDEVSTISADTYNVPVGVKVPERQVQAIRAQRQQQIQQQQMIENIPAVADGAYKASQITKES